MKQKLKIPKHNLNIDEEEFLQLLEDTKQYSDTQKLKILENIPKMKQWQFDDLYEDLKKRQESPPHKVTQKVDPNTINLTTLKNYLDSQVVSQEDAKEKLTLSFYEHLILKKEDHTYLKPNLLLIGPTGSGKTYMASLMSNYVQRPFVTANAANMVSAGYVGTKLEDILTRLYIQANRNLKEAENGIILIDEFDKMVDSNSYNSVGGEELQQEFLKLIEGGKHICKTGLERDASRIELKTDNILFIFSGAFVKIKEVMAKRHETRTIGFKHFVNKKQEATEVMHNDVIQFGIIPELVGRIQSIAVLSELTKQDLFQILKNPKNPYIHSLHKFFNYHQVNIHFTDGALEKIAEEAHKLKLGARGLKGVIDRVTQKLKFEIIKEEKKEIKITKTMIGKVFA